MTKQRRLVFFGDSICVGQGVSIHKGWVTRLAAHISELCERRRIDILVLNASASGNTTRQALERMPYDVQSHGVDWMILQFGMNDCNYWQSDNGLPRVSAPAFAANLAEIIDRASKFGASKILLNTNHPTARSAGIFPWADCSYQQSNAAYNRIIREVAGSRPGRVVLNDVEARFDELIGAGTDLNSLLLEDGLHISERGHDVYYDIIKPRVEALIDELPQRGGAHG